MKTRVIRDSANAPSKIESAHKVPNVLTTIGISYPFEYHEKGGVEGGGSTSHIPVTTH